MCFLCTNSGLTFFVSFSSLGIPLFGYR